MDAFENPISDQYDVVNFSTILINVFQKLLVYMSLQPQLSPNDLTEPATLPPEKKTETASPQELLASEQESDICCRK